MSELNHVRNPFMLMTHPEMVLAAVERSERLDRHNRRLCRPLDRPAPGEGTTAAHETAERASRPDTACRGVGPTTA